MMKRLILLLFLLNSLFVFSQIDSAPEFPGGVDKLVEYLSLNTIYPEEAKQNNIEGRVLCEFVVEMETGCFGSKEGCMNAIKPENTMR